MVEEKLAESGNVRSVLPEIFYLDGNVKYHRNPHRVFPACAAGSEFVTISPLGEVYFCPPLKRTTVGDLRKEPFDKIWTSQNARKLRRWISKGKCHCWLNCTVFPNVRRALLTDPHEPTNVERLPLWKRRRRSA